MYRKTLLEKYFFIFVFLIFFISIPKILYGYFYDIIYLETSGYYSLLRGFSIVFIAGSFYVTSLSPNSLHPYGYSKYAKMGQFLVALGIGIISLLLIGHSLIAKYSYHKVPFIDISGYIIVLLSIIFYLLLVHSMKKVQFPLQEEKNYNSSDNIKREVALTIITLIGLVGIEHGYFFLDVVLSIFFFSFLVKETLSVMWESSIFLSDRFSLDEKQICNLVNSIDGASECHNVRAHGTDSELYVDLHVRMDPKIKIIQTKPIVEQIESSLKASYSAVRDVTVHIEPKKKKGGFT
ncbi:cation diffusion facilitator family transporter [Methanohalophilus sp. RSK]|uniref:cation diffusion facilitator family transporter n=1 Tax=Methanohalophilus sp. RSK TaxID=2485783 RepID=UPI000F43D6DC|nr:cation diffusion facilitator family transporter [Methanohalophilus sp. RSK]RNI15055.1 cation diffusion facilitator family transporter [Methanohalophilus sp. RSK]